MTSGKLNPSHFVGTLPFTRSRATMVFRTSPSGPPSALRKLNPSHFVGTLPFTRSRATMVFQTSPFGRHPPELLPPVIKHIKRLTFWSQPLLF